MRKQTSTKNNTQTLVLGAGYAGITTAALLAHEGRNVTVLEAHDTLGGCASFFRRGEYTFDVGATTMSGVLPTQPTGRVFGHLGIMPDLLKQDPGMLVRMPDRDIVRHASQASWIKEMQKHFPVGDQAAFWKEQYRLEHCVWKLVNNQPSLRPTSAIDWLKLMNPGVLAALPLVQGLVRPVATLLAKYGVDKDPAFVDFINEQLLISTQNTSERAPFLTSALGLTYPSETYYPIGGMYRPALKLMRHATEHGAQMKFRRVVSSIEQMPSGRWDVSCTNGEQFETDTVVSSIPIWNMNDLTRGKQASYFDKMARTNAQSWCAFTMYFALDGIPKLSSQYVQLFLDKKIPGIRSASVFLSFSHPDDRQRAPLGHTAVTVSTHTLSEDWKGLTADEHDHKKRQIMDAVLECIGRRMHECDGMLPLHVQGGTPKTWVTYTRRYEGYVGGLPHDISRPMIFMPPNKTPFRGLYMIGDSVFPGQGTSAVMLGAWNTVNRIFAE